MSDFEKLMKDLYNKLEVDGKCLDLEQTIANNPDGFGIGAHVSKEEALLAAAKLNYEIPPDSMYSDVALFAAIDGRDLEFVENIISSREENYREQTVLSAEQYVQIASVAALEELVRIKEGAGIVFAENNNCDPMPPPQLLAKELLKIVYEKNVVIN